MQVSGKRKGLGNRKSGSARFDFFSTLLRHKDVSWTLTYHHILEISSSRLTAMLGTTGFLAGGGAKFFCASTWFDDGYLVDPASSHMLVSKIKPCMSKYKQFYGETANGSLNQL